MNGKASKQRKKNGGTALVSVIPVLPRPNSSMMMAMCRVLPRRRTTSSPTSVFLETGTRVTVTVTGTGRKTAAFFFTQFLPLQHQPTNYATQSPLFVITGGLLGFPTGAAGRILRGTVVTLRNCRNLKDPLLYTTLPTTAFHTSTDIPSGALRIIGHTLPPIMRSSDLMLSFLECSGSFLLPQYLPVALSTRWPFLLSPRTVADDQ